MVVNMPPTLQQAGPESDTLNSTRLLFASLVPGRHELSSTRLESVYGVAPLTASVRTRIAAELDHVGLVILSEPCSEPLVVVKRSEMPRLDAGAGASHQARRVKVLADRAADDVMRSGQHVALSPMTDTEREIVRNHLRWRLDLVARSEGEGSERHVVIFPL